MFFKNRISIEDMSKALYVYSNNKESIERAISILDKNNNLDKSVVRMELTLLVIITVDYLLRSEKIQKKYGEKANKLMIKYLSHFKNETEKNGTSDIFIDLLEQRGKIYNKFIEENNPSATIHFPFQIAEQLQNYCGVKNDPIFIMKVMKIWEHDFKVLTNMFDKFKLAD